MNAMIRPKKISLEASTACQLRCPSCPTANGTISKSIGTGFLRFEAFKRLVQDNPFIVGIELSNWGEIFLNPDLEKIIEYAYQHNIALSCLVPCDYIPVRSYALFEARSLLREVFGPPA